MGVVLTTPLPFSRVSSMSKQEEKGCQVMCLGAVILVCLYLLMDWKAVIVAILVFAIICLLAMVGE